MARHHDASALLLSGSHFTSAKSQPKENTTIAHPEQCCWHLGQTGTINSDSTTNTCHRCRLSTNGRTTHGAPLQPLLLVPLLI